MTGLEIIQGIKAGHSLFKILSSEEVKKVWVLARRNFSVLKSKALTDRYNKLKSEDILKFYENETPIIFSLVGETFIIPCSYMIAPKQNGIINVQNITLDFLDNKFELSNEIDAYTKPIRKFAEKDSRLFDGEVIRIADLSISSNKAKVVLQRASYFDSITTNFSIDFLPPNRSESLRQYLHGTRQSFGDFLDNKLVNHIGIVCMVETIDGMLIGQLRSYKVANRGGTLSSSVSGGLALNDLKDYLFTHSFVNAIIKGVEKEIYKELGFIPDIENIRFLGALRDFERGGKPDFYFCLKSKYSFSEIKRFHKINAEEKYESNKITGFEFHSNKLDGSENSKLRFQKRVSEILLKASNQNLTFYAGTLLTAKNILQKDL